MTISQSIFYENHTLRRTCNIKTTIKIISVKRKIRFDWLVTRYVACDEAMPGIRSAASIVRLYYSGTPEARTTLIQKHISKPVMEFIFHTCMHKILFLNILSAVIHLNAFRIPDESPAPDLDHLTQEAKSGRLAHASLVVSKMRQNRILGIPNCNRPK